MALTHKQVEEIVSLAEGAAYGMDCDREDYLDLLQDYLILLMQSPEEDK